MKKILFLTGFLLFQSLQSQNTEDAWIYFTDKPQAAQYLANPISMLSQRALDRRNRLNISLDEKDVPIDNNYLQQIKNTTGITYLAHSKWLNAVHIQGNENDINNLLNLSFVDHIEFANKNIGTISRPQPNNLQPNNKTNTRTTYDYGASYEQIHMLNGELMHEQNFTGQGVLLAIIDAGFIDVNSADIFQHLYQNNNITDVYNFVSHDTNVYQFSSHGTAVLSTIATQSQGEMVGTAPEVSIALYVSEDISQEMPIEETYWTQAAERADSLGVDIINTSLSYQDFDRPEYSYTMNDLDGQTSFISRAAATAVSRGITVVVSAGNSGNTSWPKIGMPADSPFVITVGAVDNNRIKTDFSSTGPTADQRIKPDVMALGQNTTIYNNGNIQTGSGTSFSSPIIAGMVACMIQAYPHKTPMQIKQDLISISDRYNQPDNEYGYGIPDFSLYQTNTVTEITNKGITIYPNPAKKYIHISKQTDYQIVSIEGKLIMKGKTRKKQIDISQLSDGIYYLSTPEKTFKFIKE